MEILSPAGNFESLTAAVRSGADAVYLGLKEFSARRNADNFDLSELRRAAEYCRTRGVKLYVAINTMIKEKEMPEAVKAAADAINCGADALIVSDLGLISALNRALPEVPLHASTQMTVHSPAALTCLKQLGIKRVVLGREMSREEIKDFCSEAKRAGIEVEVFVHGALCMCVSGQCLLSSALGGRSGNRGLCAGPCRLEFSSSGSGRYDLSLKDLSLIPYLEELEKNGVASVKIEGRMKRAEYVAAATAACRAALDKRPDRELENALKDVFSRSGFTDGYYKGVIGKDMFGVRTADDVQISKTAYSYLHTLYKNERQSVPVNIEAVINGGEPAALSLADNNGNRVSVKGATAEPAQRREINNSDIVSALSKLGGTPYFAESINVNLQDGLYMSAAELNSLRREAVAALDRKRALIPALAEVNYIPAKTKKRPAGSAQIYVKFLSSDSVPEDLNGVDGVILPLFEDFSRIPKGVLKIADLPRYITDEEKILSRLKSLKAKGVFTAFCDNLSAIALSNAAGFKIIASNGLNCANRECISALLTLGADKVTLSAETYMPSAKDLADCGGTGLFAYGRLPLMLTKNCPVKNTKPCAECKGQSVLTDRMGVRFPVRCRDGYSEIFNSSPTYLADKKDDISVFDFLVLSFTDESPETVKRIISDYVTAAPPPEEFTRGMYYKNIP